MQKFKETGDSRYIYQNEQDKACFQHDMAYGDFKDLTKKQLQSPKLLQWSMNFLIKKTGCGIKKENTSDHQLAEESGNSRKKKVHPTFIDSISGADLADRYTIIK